MKPYNHKIRLILTRIKMYNPPTLSVSELCFILYMRANPEMCAFFPKSAISSQDYEGSLIRIYNGHIW